MQHFTLEYKDRATNEKSSRLFKLSHLETNCVTAPAADDAALPPNWDDMKGDRLKLFPLAAGSKEYNDVEKELRRTNLRVNIIQVSI